MGRGAAPLQTSPRVFEHFLAPGNPGREWGRMHLQVPTKCYKTQADMVKPITTLRLRGSGRGVRCIQIREYGIDLLLVNSSKIDRCKPWEWGHVYEKIIFVENTRLDERVI